MCFTLYNYVSIVQVFSNFKIQKSCRFVASCQENRGLISFHLQEPIYLSSSIIQNKIFKSKKVRGEKSPLICQNSLYRSLSDKASVLDPHERALGPCSLAHANQGFANLDTMQRVREKCLGAAGDGEEGQQRARKLEKRSNMHEKECKVSTSLASLELF